MKLPAVAIAVAFGGGVLLGGLPFFASHADQHSLLASLIGLAVVCLVVVGVLVWRDWVAMAAAVTIASFVVLGTLAACVAEQPLAADHILSRWAAHQIPEKTPLPWHGVLRSEPSRLPWGYSLEMELRGVELADGYIPVRGGMRLGFTPREDDPALPELHAGDEVRVLTEARLPLVYKDPGAFDRRAFLAREGVHVQGTLRASVLMEKTGTAPPTLGMQVARVRGRLRKRLDAMFPESPQTAAILRAMLLGDRSFVERRESVDFQKTGVFHVLVVAGLHVGALATFLFWVTRKLRVARWARVAMVLGVLFAYVAVVEQRAPVLRAALMAGVVILGTFFFRRLELLNSAGLAALALLVAKPDYMRDGGFVLSFVAIGTIAGLAIPVLERTVQPLVQALDSWRDVTRDAGHAPKLAQLRLDFRDVALGLTAGMEEERAKWLQDFGAGGVRMGLRLAELAVLTFLLQLGMLPLMAGEFHRVSLLGPVANLFVVPLTGMIVPFGFAALGVASVWMRAGVVMGHPLAWLVLAQQKIVALLAEAPHGSYRIPGPPVWLTTGFFVIGIALVVWLRLGRIGRNWEWKTLAFLLGLGTVVIAVYPFPAQVARGELEVTVLDVAQGDSILVVSPKGSTLLIDGGGAFEGFRGREEHLGPDPGEEAVSAYLWWRGFKKLDAVALTHGHQDHVGGLTAVLENFQVGRLLLGRETEAPAFVRLKHLAGELHVPVEHEERQGKFDWDGVEVEILWPEDVADPAGTQAKNNDSLVVRLKYGERSFLLPGDAEKQVEYRILGEGNVGELHADVLKVAHHGSKNSTMPEFLGAVNPQLSIISAGSENPYGHPAPELLERLGENGSKIFRTDRNGAVQVRTDGHVLKVDCTVGCRPETLTLAKTQPPNDKQGEEQ